jgi:hypothetical protein
MKRFQFHMVLCRRSPHMQQAIHRQNIVNKERK